MKVLYTLIVLFIAFASNSFAQSLNMRLNHYFYTWERADSIGGSSTTHLRGYQNLSFDVSGKAMELQHMDADRRGLRK
jgi:hypothetical protein